MTGQIRLAGCRVLVIEDDRRAALRIEDLLDKLGCVTIGPYPTLAEAQMAAKTADIDLALLDVNLAGVLSYPVADILAERQVPFILLTGYGGHALPADHPDWQWHAKPFVDAELAGRIETLLNAPSAVRS